MYNTAKVITTTVIIVLIFLVMFPLWYVLASGKAAYIPEPEIISEKKQCIEAGQYMRDKHMDLLNDWMESVVRQGTRTYVASDCQEYNMSLTGTCLDCHSNKGEFCDRCHNYVGVQPECWDCHIVPEED
ncbi:sulfate reduction electron transfer complex DsrMKJOP subunit DsrJ [Chloroflexota bacterium]